MIQRWRDQPEIDAGEIRPGEIAKGSATGARVVEITDEGFACYLGGGKPRRE